MDIDEDQVIFPNPRMPRLEDFRSSAHSEDDEEEALSKRPRLSSSVHSSRRRRLSSPQRRKASKVIVFSSSNTPEQTGNVVTPSTLAVIDIFGKNLHVVTEQLQDMTDDSMTGGQPAQDDSDQNDQDEQADDTRFFDLPHRDDQAWRMRITRTQNPQARLAPAYDPEDPEDLVKMSKFSLNSGNLQVPAIPWNVATENFTKETLDLLTDSPGEYMLITLMKGGQLVLSKDNPKIEHTIEDSLKDLLQPGEHIQITRPICEVEPNRMDKYAAPISLIAKFKGNHIKEMMLRQGTFAIDRETAFHALPIATKIQTWNIGLFTTTHSGDVEAVRLDIIWAFSKFLWTDMEARRLIDVATRNLNNQTLDYRAYVVSRSINVKRLVNKNDRDVHYLVTMEPTTTDIAHWDATKDYLRSCTITDGIFKIQPAYDDKKARFCVVCKLDTHASFKCRFAEEDKDFRGPIEQFKRPDGSSNNSRGMRGGRGGRGRGRRQEGRYGDSHRPY